MSDSKETTLEGSEEIDDLPARYHEYLDRFMTEIGDTKLGAFAKWSGRLIKKLSFEEFTPAYLEYTEIRDRYEDSLERGDTINDVVLKLLREKAANLVLKPPTL
ncbi:MAG: hypothetical protein ABI867_01345 [Kofleriaceae bacterium]